MKNRNFILYLIVLAFSLLNIGIDYDEYNDLENKNVAIIKGIHKNLIEDIRFSSLVFYMIALSRCSNIESIIERNKCEDSSYGDRLLNYINNKNINDIQLTKKEYVDMTNNPKSCVAEFEDFKHISDPEDYKLVSEFLDNPDSEINKQRITDFFAKMNVEIDADALAKSMPRYKKLYNF
jgi:hypothetical protein